MPRPLIDRDNDALHLQQFRLARVDTHLRHFSFGRNEQMPLGSCTEARLQNAAVLTPLATNDADNAPGWLALDIGRRDDGRLLVKHVARILLIILQDDLTRSPPLVFGQQFQCDDVTVYGAIKAVTSLDENLIQHTIFNQFGAQKRLLCVGLTNFS